MRWPHVQCLNMLKMVDSRSSPPNGRPLTVQVGDCQNIHPDINLNWFCWWVYLYLMIYSHSKPILVASHEHLWWLSWRAQPSVSISREASLTVWKTFTGWLSGGSERLGYLYSLYISHSMGSRSELRIEFPNHLIAGWWFGCHFLFSHILGIIIPIDFHIFQRGEPTTNQIVGEFSGDATVGEPSEPGFYDSPLQKCVWISHRAHGTSRAHVERAHGIDLYQVHNTIPLYDIR